MTRPTARVLALLELLQAGGVRTVPALAERLGVDERTVRRYAEHLVDLGIPVRSHRGRYGGYALAPGYKLPPLMLTDDEAVAVALGLVAGQRTGLVVGDLAAAEGALAKIRRVLPAALSRRLDALVSSAEYTSTGRSGTPPDTAVLLALAEATRARRTVVVDYTSWDGSSGERSLDCYGLVFHSGRWYATGHDHRRGEVRTFRIDRVTRIVSVGDVYTAPGDFDAVEQVMAGMASVPWTHQVVVTLHAPMEQVRARLPASVGRLSEVPSGVRLEARAERLAGMALLLAGLGWPFTVEQPDTLRSEVAALADRLREDAARAPSDHTS
jgi:predicted DNA-binding transcriptional regulator YafY